MNIFEEIITFYKESEKEPSNYLLDFLLDLQKAVRSTKKVVRIKYIKGTKEKHYLEFAKKFKSLGLIEFLHSHKTKKNTDTTINTDGVFYIKSDGICSPFKEEEESYYYIELEVTDEKEVTKILKELKTELRKREVKLTRPLRSFSFGPNNERRTIKFIEQGAFVWDTCDEIERSSLKIIDKFIETGKQRLKYSELKRLYKNKNCFNAALSRLRSVVETNLCDVEYFATRYDGREKILCIEDPKYRPPE